MKQNQSQSKSNEFNPSSGKKKPYLKPEVQVYGDLHLLTQGSSGMKSDGMSTQRM